MRESRTLDGMTTARAYEPEPTLDSFGARLAIIRWSKGWNVKEAALACRIPEANWREWEGGRSPRNIVEKARLISEATGYSDYWLLTGNPTAPPSDVAPITRAKSAATRRHARTGVINRHLALVA